MKRTLLKEGAWVDLPSQCIPIALFDIMWTPEDMAVVASWCGQHEHYSSVPPPTVPELYQYCGQQLFMGIYQLPEHSDYWRESDPILAPSIFHKGLPRNRWCDINAHIHISVDDLCARIRTNFRSHRTPSAPIDIDETQLCFEGRYKGII